MAVQTHAQHLQPIPSDRAAVGELAKCLAFGGDAFDKFPFGKPWEFLPTLFGRMGRKRFN
jgi:hypothetical protein